MTGTDPAAVGDVLDMGAPEPPNITGVESMAWVNYGDGYGPTLAGEADADDIEAYFLLFGKSSNGDWKFYLGGKTYIDWAEVLRRFGPVRVTHIETSEELTND
ncbi:hypothetical protein JVX90_00150 [Gordonia sp. PDNC005]|uniref:hypothetical protein n=1 Tax=Gordonia sp. PDNC005 TaxID=2811424 RepID=UPI0019662A24|nr:hypothetical protein [Gordonia sp. PDNC005]QRY62723.1 hypothetical protein JVX90_00150 [Gordonia sp. PDNC005]